MTSKTKITDIMERIDDTGEYLIKLREKSGMGRKDFCQYFDIPYRTLQDWELGNRKMPDYLLKLIEYKLEKEGLLDGIGTDVKIKKERSTGARKKKEKAAVDILRATEIQEKTAEEDEESEAIDEIEHEKIVENLKVAGSTESAEDMAFAENEDYEDTEDTMSWLD